MTEFDGLSALVTGGCSGIGAATAALLARRGARVAVLDVQIDQPPDGVSALHCDVSDGASVADAVGIAAELLGGIDVLVNNAGIGAIGDISRNDDEEWARVLDVNVTGMARVARAALPHLRRSAHPVIVNVCSAVAFVGLRQRALYPSTARARAPSTP